MKGKVSISALTLLLVCMLPIALNTPLVQADRGGTGKFLTVAIVGEGYVTATKVNSGETWDFYWADPPVTEKVGAGTVELEAFAYEGWEFSHWEGDLAGTSENPTEYKTEKYGYLVAVFEVLTYTIYASADDEGWIEPDGNVTVTYGEDVTFTFGPNNASEDHVSTILVDYPDEPPLGGFLETYTFEHVTEDHSIHVCLDPIGTVSVAAGPGGGYNLDEVVSLTVVEYVETEGVILGSSVIDQVPEGTSIYLYVTAMDPAPTITGEGVVFAFLVPEGTDPSTLTIVKGDSIQAIYSDVNGDLVVDSTDTSIVAEGKNQPYNPFLDLNNDGVINQTDVWIVNENKGTTLTDVTGEVVGEHPGPYFVTTIPIMEDDPPFRLW